MTKTTKKVLIMSCVLTPFACLMHSFVHVFISAHVAAVRTTCLSNVKSLASASLQYSYEYDDRLPKAEGWMDRVTPFVSSEKGAETFHCPELERDQYGYAMNSTIAGRSIAKIDSLASTYLIFETETLGRNVSGPPNSILKTPRHGTISASFADGHAKNSRPR